jgi:hypothetical protein
VESIEYTNGYGSYDAAIAPSNSNHIAIACLGRIWVSTDKGLTFTKTPLPEKVMSPNGNFRMNGPHLGFDPARPQTLYVGTALDGLHVTHDTGATWTKMASIPNATTERAMCVAFDRSGGLIGGKTKNIYVSSAGHGVFFSSDAGATWALSAGSPIVIAHLIAHPTSGTVFASGLGIAELNGPIHRKASGGTWTTVSGTEAHNVVLNPENANQVWAHQENGRLCYSSNAGVTFGEPIVFTRAATDIPYLEWTEESYMSNGCSVYDPTTGRIYFAMGIGVFWTPAPTSQAPIVWTSQSIGNEQLCSKRIQVTPNGKAYGCYLDRGVFSGLETRKMPLKHGPNRIESIVHCYDVDWAPEDETFLVAKCAPRRDVNAGQSAFTTNGGDTWTEFANQPFPIDVKGGAVAVSTKRNFVMMASNDLQPKYTTDGGVTWTSCNIGTGVNRGWIGANYVNRHPLLADKANPGHFYIYNWGGEAGDAAAMAGMWKSTNGGAAWTRIKTGNIGSFTADAWNSMLKWVPGQPGHMLWASGPQGNPGDNIGSETPYRSTDYGVTWTAIAGFNEPHAIGVGKGLPGAYPAIYVVGHRGSQYGFWRTTDNCTTWHLLDSYPLGWFDGVNDIQGDMNTFGLVYISYSGSGGQIMY